MKIKMTKDQGWLMLWQVIGMSAIYYAIWHKDLLFGTIGIVLLVVKFRDINQ